MSLFVAALASGSNGNCYYVGNDQHAVLVDVGISCRELEKRMQRQSLSISKVKAIFISHEHTDHISGLKSILKKYSIPVYISAATLSGARVWIEKQRFYHITGVPVQIGDIAIIPFSKHHDAADPYSFVISSAGTHVGVFTDIGLMCTNVQTHFSQCHAVFLESNYDREMLMKGNYPWVLKKRISGGMGHLSNEQALELFRQHKSASLSHLFLSHLSKNNNCPQLVKNLFDTHAGSTQMIVASRECETAVYHINGNAGNAGTLRGNKPQQGVLQFD